MKAAPGEDDDFEEVKIDRVGVNQKKKPGI
mgnify:FL=1